MRDAIGLHASALVSISIAISAQISISRSIGKTRFHDFISARRVTSAEAGLTMVSVSTQCEGPNDTASRDFCSRHLANQRLCQTL